MSETLNSTMLRRVSFLAFIAFFVLPGELPAYQDGEPVRKVLVRPEFRASDQRLPGLIPSMILQRPRIGLVLSGGGARGLASIGVLEAFEAEGLPVDFITGTSIGSIVGGLYASGYSPSELRALVDTTDWDAVLSFSDDSRRQDLFYDQKLAEDRSLLVLRFDGLQPVLPEAFSSGQRLTHYLNILSLQAIYHPGPSFDDLKIPFRAVATDLISGSRVIIGNGDLAEALRASTSVPLLFQPVRRDTTQLLDGGLTSNIPADVARMWGADLVVAVDVTSPLRSAPELNAPWEIADQIIGISMQLANQEQLKNADYVIRPRLGDHLSSDFNDLDSVIEQGRLATSAIVPILRKGLRERSPSAGRVFPFPTFVTSNPQWEERLSTLVRRDSVSEAALKDFMAELYTAGDLADVWCSVEEYPGRSIVRLETQHHPVLNDVTFAGVSVLSEDSLRSIFKPMIGRPLNVAESRSALENVLHEYRRRGFSLASVDSARFDPATGAATIIIDEGVVHRRTIVGTRKTKDYVIWRELPWAQGDVFQIDKVAEGLTNLYGTALFDQVSVSVRKESTADPRNVVEINVRERYTDLIRFGILINNERNVQPAIDVRDENFLGIGSELGLRFFGGLRNRYYLGEFNANRIFNSYLTFNLQAYYDLKDINVFKDEPLQTPDRWNRVRDGEYREVREGFAISFGTQLERLGQVTIRGRTERQRQWNIFNQPVQGEVFRVNAVRLGTRIDSRDRFPFPEEGAVMEFFYESGTVENTGREGFSRIFFDYAWFETPFSRQTIRPRVVLGFGDETVPLTEQFTLGGAGSFYGYREDNARGRQLFVVSLQYRYFLPVKIIFNTYFSVRYDLGHIWEKAEQIRLKDLRHGIGLSLGFDTPIGPAEISVGRAFFIRKDLFDNPLSYGPILTYFKIGYAF